MPNLQLCFDASVFDCRLSDAGPVQIAPAQNAEAAKNDAVDLSEVLGVVRAISRQITQWESQQEQLRQDMLNLAVDLATVATGQVLRRQLDEGGFEMRPVVEQLINNLNLGQPVTIQLNGADHARLALTVPPDHWGAVELVSTSRLAPGSCLVSGPNGAAIYEVFSHLEQIRCQLMEGLHDDK